MGRRRSSWLLLGLALGACVAPRTDWKRGEWVVVSDLARPGLRVSDSGRVVGEEADLLRSVAEDTDRVLVWTRADSERGLELLETGRADVGAFSANVLAEWGERVDALPPPFTDLDWRLTPARAGVLDELLGALERVRPGGVVETRP